MLIYSINTILYSVILMAESTIGASMKLKKFLISKKLVKRESYEDVIWRLLEGVK